MHFADNTFTCHSRTFTCNRVFDLYLIVKQRNKIYQVLIHMQYLLKGSIHCWFLVFSRVLWTMWNIFYMNLRYDALLHIKLPKMIQYFSASIQRWKVTKYLYSSTVLKYDFVVLKNSNRAIKFFTPINQQLIFKQRWKMKKYIFSQVLYMHRTVLRYFTGVIPFYATLLHFRGEYMYFNICTFYCTAFIYSFSLSYFENSDY